MAKSKVVLKNSHEIILYDYQKLMHQAEYKKFISKDMDTI